MKSESMVISLIGRPNVGKSSLFNRLMHKANKAITHDSPGVTRDRHYGVFVCDEEEVSKECLLVDTGGFYPEKIEENQGNSGKERNADYFFNLMTEHAQLAIDESDLVLLILDVREGLVPFDISIANYLRKKKKKFLAIINKFDSDKQLGEENQFFSLGLSESEIYKVSSAHGLGIHSLRERISLEMNYFKKNISESRELGQGVVPRENVISKLAIVGAPNAGKSTLLNQLVGSKRALVSDIPGTTVDPIEGYFDLYLGPQVKDFDKINERLATEKSEETIESFQEEKESQFVEDDVENQSYWRSIQVVDTAGIRKQKTIKELVESQSVFRALRSISDADIVIFLVDITKGVGHQDRRLIDIALEKGKSIIVCLNKVDLREDLLKDQKTQTEWLLDLRAKISWLNYCDILFLSAKNKKFFKALRRSIIKTILIRKKKISTGELNRAVSNLIEKNSIYVKKSNGARLKVKYVSMVRSDPPTFLFFVNKSKEIPENYRRYLKNGLREEFKLDNTPIHLIFRTGAEMKKRGAAELPVENVDEHR